MKKSIISKVFIDTILKQYLLPWSGIHGVSHWARVLENGLRLQQHTGANIQVVQYFAVFHDVKRINEGIHNDHGRQGAEYAASLHGSLFELGDEDFDRLYTACAYHTDGLTEGDITIQTCWDADRLDLGRAGIIPLPQYLCTDAAKDSAMIEWANKRSCEGFIPEIVYTEWGFDPNLSH